MWSKRSAILLALAALPVWGQISNNLASLPDGPATFPHHGPRKVVGFGPDRVIDGITVYESPNWSGYAVVGSAFTEAKGSWIVPPVDCRTRPSTAASFWVGIDGWTSSTVEQAGTDSDCDGLTPTYYAWYEFFPRGGVTITSVPVVPGNRMSAEIRYDDPLFTITIANETTGAAFSISSRLAGAERSSAEWITETPCCTVKGNFLPLSDFGTVDYGDDYTGLSGTNYAADASTSGTMSAFGSNLQESILVNAKGEEEDVPSAISADGTSFTETWQFE